jgi:hypothetical protein
MAIRLPTLRIIGCKGPQLLKIQHRRSVSGPPIRRKSRETATYQRRGGIGALALWVGQMDSSDEGEMGGVLRWFETLCGELNGHEGAWRLLCRRKEKGKELGRGGGVQAHVLVKQSGWGGPVQNQASSAHGRA